MPDNWQLLMDEICFRFNDVRAKVERSEALAPNSYGAGFDRGYSDALGELLEYMAGLRRPHPMRDDTPRLSPTGTVAYCGECSGWGEWLERDKRRWTIMKCCPVCHGSGFWPVADNIKVEKDASNA